MRPTIISMAAVAVLTLGFSVAASAAVPAPPVNQTIGMPDGIFDVDDRDIALADDVTDRALEGERPGIVRHHAAHAGHDLLDRVGREVEIFIEGNVVGHAFVTELSDACVILNSAILGI